jgi:hypothetical protein
MHQNPLAVFDTSFRQRGGSRLGSGVEVRPGPGCISPDQRGTVGKPPRRLDQQMRQIGGWDQRNGSKMET